jgi:hypothetical protein
MFALFTVLKTAGAMLAAAELPKMRPDSALSLTESGMIVSTKLLMFL